MKQQFDTRWLLSATAAIAVTLVLSVWINDKSNWHFYSSIPPLFIPSISVMGAGMVFSMLIWLAGMVTMGAMAVNNSPRPISIVLVAGLQIVGFTTAVPVWAYGIKLVLAMLLACLVLCAETYFRKLPRVYLCFCGISFVITAAWYVLTICVSASASV